MRRLGQEVPQVAQLVLQRDDEEGAQDRARQGAHAADQGHQDDEAGHRPVHVRQRLEAEHDGLRRARQAGQRGRQDEGDEFITVHVVAERTISAKPATQIASTT